MASLNERIKKIEAALFSVGIKVQDLSQNTEEIYKKPISIVGGGYDKSLIRPIDIRSGMGNYLGSPVLWNNTEIDAVFGTQPLTPTIGYNKHTHSRFSGGALIRDAIEIVEYNWGTITNKHSQQFLSQQLEIKTEKNSNDETVEKIGLLDLVFNPDTQTWGTPAYEIDVKKCYLVERDKNGVIVVDSKGQQKRSLLYNEDQTKTSIVWDENGNCWRFYAAYAPGES